MDFLKVRHRVCKNGQIEVYPDFVVGNVKDIMARGKDFYAVWDEAAGMWSTHENDVVRIVDDALEEHAKSVAEGSDGSVIIRKMRDFSTKSWKMYKDYIRSLPDAYHQLDERLTFSNTEVSKKDYVSRRLPYPLQEGDHSAWDELAGTLYSPEELEKIEWAIGSVVSGDSRKIQKFLVFYGAPGTGKGTIMEIVAKLFDGYFNTFEASALTTSGNTFATEVFRDNPLVCIQQDGDLSRIEDNTRLNSVVSHELMTMHEKYKSSYTARANALLFLGSNKPVKITDAKSGLIRRLIDVSPRYSKANPIPGDKYESLMGHIVFELPGIARHCLDIYKKLGKHYYDSYRPTDMMYKTDVFFNFVDDSALIFQKQDGTTLKAAYAMYKAYCEESGADFRLPMHKFREELKNYFKEYEEVGRDVDGRQVRKYYSGFMGERFRGIGPDEQRKDGEKPDGYSGKLPDWLVLAEQKSRFDLDLADAPAQLADESGKPVSKWENVRQTIKDVDTSRTHYALVPGKLVTIDFDLRDESGEKNLQLNLQAAASWPSTYAEVSNGGRGLHLAYWYDGDTSGLARIFAPGIEIKFQSPNSTIQGFPLRRRVSLCNDRPIAHISSGLPKKEEKVIDFQGVKSEKQLRNFVASCMRKEHHGATKPEVDFIAKALDDAYRSGLKYDISDMRPAVTAFAQGSTNQAQTCLKTCLRMKWKSEDSSCQSRAEACDESSRKQEQPDSGPIIFFDVEVFPNLFLVCWKVQGEGRPISRMINPGPKDIEELLGMKLVGFNNRRYDNHMLYACYIGYSPAELYELSQRIIGKRSDNAMFREAYNISYTDIYDFCSTKQSLKKWEIELGIHHQELPLPWDQPVPEEKWEMVADYCENDVRATEAVWNANQPAWTARKILAALSGLTVNDTTNQHTTAIIFQGDRSPQSRFHYRNMGERQEGHTYSFPCDFDREYTVFEGAYPVFPGYSYAQEEVVVNAGKKNERTTTRWVSRYRGEEIGEGGYVYAEPGIYRNVALLDIASMHPSSIVAENLFGDRYTSRFRDILQARILIKHKAFDEARHILDGKLAPYLDDEGAAKDLAQALKIAINSVYGLTSAKFDNPFRDIRNADNIVAKRGALFMVNLKHVVQQKGFTVAHIKTDSIKIPDATPEIISFVQEYGKLYGYNFEHEATYDRMCLVNDAVYIAKYDEAHGGKWTATGAQFQHPYIFKTLFSREPVVFEDLCETKSVTSGALYLNLGTEEEPKYSFVGRTGQFVPMKGEHGGLGLLCREKDGKYYSAAGTKGWKWMDAELVRGSKLEKDVDMGYFNTLVTDALETIAQYGDPDEFREG